MDRFDDIGKRRYKAAEKFDAISEPEALCKYAQWFCDQERDWSNCSPYLYEEYIKRVEVICADPLKTVRFCECSIRFWNDTDVNNENSFFIARLNEIKGNAEEALQDYDHAIISYHNAWMALKSFSDYGLTFYEYPEYALKLFCLLNKISKLYHITGNSNDEELYLDRAADEWGSLYLHLGDPDNIDEGLRLSKNKYLEEGFTDTIKARKIMLRRHPNIIYQRKLRDSLLDAAKCEDIGNREYLLEAVELSKKILKKSNEEIDIARYMDIKYLSVVCFCEDSGYEDLILQLDRKELNIHYGNNVVVFSDDKLLQACREFESAEKTYRIKAFVYNENSISLKERGYFNYYGHNRDMRTLAAFVLYITIMRREDCVSKDARPDDEIEDSKTHALSVLNQCGYYYL